MTTMSRARGAVVAVVAVLALGACGTNSDDTTGPYAPNYELVAEMRATAVAHGVAVNADCASSVPVESGWAQTCGYGDEGLVWFATFDTAAAASAWAERESAVGWVASASGSWAVAANDRRLHDGLVDALSVRVLAAG